MKKKNSPPGSAGEKTPGENRFAGALRAGEQRNYRKAVLILEELIAGFGAPSRAYLYLGRAFHALHDYSRALAAFNDYIHLENRAWEGYFFSGRSYLAAGMPYKALIVLRKALELKAESPVIMAMMGVASLRARRSAEAVDILQKAVEISAKQQSPSLEQGRIYRAYINALFIRGIRLCRNEEYDLGIQMLRFVLANSGNGKPGPRGSALLRLELGRACRETGLFGEALEHYTEALNQAPGDLRIRWYRTSMLMTLGKTADALEEIERIKSLGSNLPSLPWNSRLVDLYMIRTFLETGEWRRAAGAARGWIKTRGGSALVHSLYAEALRNLRNYPASLNHLERAKEFDEKDINIRYQTVLTAWEGEDWKTLGKTIRTLRSVRDSEDLVRRFSILLEARKEKDSTRIIPLLQDAIRKMGPEPELMYALGEHYLAAGLPALALSWFRKTRNLKENHEKAWLGEIAALEALVSDPERPPFPAKGGKQETDHTLAAGTSAELGAAYDAYVQRWPDNYVIRRERAMYLIRTFEYGQAVPELEALLAWEPSNRSLRRVLAYAYRKTGRYREAAFFLKALLQENPGSVDLLIEYTGCLERTGAAAYARTVLEKAMTLFPGVSEIPMALGLFYYRDKKKEKAFDLLREAAARNTGDPRPYQWMAVLARRSGETEEARRFDHEAGKRSSRRI